eukprot:2845820-Pleurochrysis_carterae.AAC.1
MRAHRRPEKAEDSRPRMTPSGRSGSFIWSAEASAMPMAMSATATGVRRDGRSRRRSSPKSRTKSGMVPLSTTWKEMEMYERDQLEKPMSSVVAKPMGNADEAKARSESRGWRRRSKRVSTHVASAMYPLLMAVIANGKWKLRVVSRYLFRKTMEMEATYQTTTHAGTASTSGGEAQSEHAAGGSGADSSGASTATRPTAEAPSGLRHPSRAPLASLSPLSSCAAACSSSVKSAQTTSSEAIASPEALDCERPLNSGPLLGKSQTWLKEQAEANPTSPSLQGRSDVKGSETLAHTVPALGKRCVMAGEGIRSSAAANCTCALVFVSLFTRQDVPGGAWEVEPRAMPASSISCGGILLGMARAAVIAVPSASSPPPPPPPSLNDRSTKAAMQVTRDGGG